MTNSTSNQINAELTKITDWLAVNKLSRNANKAKMMIFHSKQRTLKNNDIPNIKVNAIPIEYVIHLKFLCVIIDCNMTCSSYINYIANKSSRICGIISRLKHHVLVYI